MTAKLTSKVVPSYSSLDSASLNYCLIHIDDLLRVDFHQFTLLCFPEYNRSIAKSLSWFVSLIGDQRDNTSIAQLIRALSAPAVGGHVGVARAGVVVVESARRHAAATTTACAACPVA
ncbi:hypothetical protein SDJN03_12230, partial [Cucurbita argyrosperma subsp. sororia]